MITTNQKKFVNSLKQKKYRSQHNCFVVEGEKMVEELLQSDFKVEAIYATESWLNNNHSVSAELVSNKDLSIISSFKTPNEVLAVVRKSNQTLDKEYNNELTIALDNIQDPGNLGTIVRTADWFGVNNIICSENSVDIHNPKVLQATMGAFFRVKVTYTNLQEFFTENNTLNVIGALLDGDNVYQEQLEDKGTVLLMGNESKGISSELIPYVNKRITIPRFGESESLNVGVATAILCSEFKRTKV